MSQLTLNAPIPVRARRDVPDAAPNAAARQVLILLGKELRDAFRNRWFLLYAALFALLVSALSYLSMAGTGSGGMAGFGRTAAGLINIVLLIVPLMALTVGAGLIASERERGTLEYLLSHPIGRTELLAGKYLGAVVALLTALTLGFSIAILAMSGRGHLRHLDSFLPLVLATYVLAAAMLSVGLLISVISQRASMAVGLALLVWFALVFLSDLGLMGSALAFRLPVRNLFWLSLINPMQVFKFSVLGSVGASLDVLGPAGTFASQAYGHALPALFAAVGAAWVVGPAGAAWLLFARRGDA